MSPTFYHILHVVSVIALGGYTFYAFSGPAPETRRKILAITGVASLLILISGFGLLSKLYANQFQLWVYLKLAAWLVLSALSGIAYRRRSLLGILQVIALAAVFLSVYAVYVKPV
ncbi:hypothetical protein [Nibricoccus sp. IMCC34717]|uniref:hypothetical protein n=1 Tax=Nibricoccus sp. IMCC34717 TaxID=3034021 RepID=UPI0038510F3B